MTNPLLQLKELGQSVWYDNIDRSQLASGQFQRMLEEDGIVGVTANPTILISRSARVMPMMSR